MNKEFVKPLMKWYKEHARRLPWRQDPTPYHVWISEIMLQQTRVEAVRGYYTRFLERLPKVEDLAEVEEDQLMKLWQGLGYYNRVRNMQKAAKVIVEEKNGVFPDSYEALLELPGIGEYTAGAIASIGFNRQVPAVDGNIYRIYTRMERDNRDITKAQVKREIRQEIESVLPKEAGIFNQALMDLGATVCIPNGSPLCNQCPIVSYCKSHKAGDMLEYPVKPAKKPRKIQYRTIFIVEYQKKIWIQKRPDQGLLAGLWEFPSQEGKLSLNEVIKMLGDQGVVLEEMKLLGSGKHIFSHIEWHMLGYQLQLTSIPKAWAKEGVWCTREELKEKYSIPSAYSCYYNQL